MLFQARPKASLLFTSILALLQGLDGVNAASLEVCFTKRASRAPPGPVPTTSIVKTITFPQVVIVTTTPGKTVTPTPPVTTTNTATTTTTTTLNLPQSTDTFTEFATTTEITTVDSPVVTSTATQTTTTTTTTTFQGTSTLAAPTGFRPVLDTLPNSVLKKRALGGGSLMARAPKAICPVANKKPPPSYPAAVTCVVVVKALKPTTLTRTASKTTTVTAATPTVTVSATTTETTTVTNTTPNAQTTTTVPVTTTITSTNPPVTTTTTTTTTTTVTAQTATATAYGICAPGARNYAGTISGQGIDTAFARNSQDYASSNTNDGTKEACCSTCAANPLCVSTAFEPDFPAGQQCFLIVSSQDTCAVGSYQLTAVYGSPALPPDGGYFFSNGNCGVYDAAQNGA